MDPNRICRGLKCLVYLLRLGHRRRYPAHSILMHIAIYFLVIDGSRVAELSNPQFVDMFWWEYRVTSVDNSLDRSLRDPQLWENVNFTIVDADNREPNPNTFSGGYGDFCNGLTDCLTFRSLPPPDPI